MSTTYKQLGTEIGELVDTKNAAYGDSLGKSVEALNLLYPNGLRPDQYLDAILAARDFDKRSRLAQGHLNDDEDPHLDLCGYGLMGLAMHRAARMHAKPQSSATYFSTSQYPLVLWLHTCRLENRANQCGYCGETLYAAQVSTDAFNGELLTFCGPTCLKNARERYAELTEGKEPAPCPNDSASGADTPSTTTADSASHPASAPAKTAETASPSSASDSPTPSMPPSPNASPATDASASTAQAPASSPGPASEEQGLRQLQLRLALDLNEHDGCAWCGDDLVPQNQPPGRYYQYFDHVTLAFCNGIHAERFTKRLATR